MNTNTVGAFFKISEKQFVADLIKAEPCLSEDEAKKVYAGIKQPRRATDSSAGYDFYLPYDLNLNANVPTIVTTGVSVQIADGWMLALFPRSGLGFKYGMRLENTVGIIDPDYFDADNEGHILAKITVSKDLSLKAGDRFMQGIFLPFGITLDDNPALQRRTGGFGSTGVR